MRPQQWWASWPIEYRVAFIVAAIGLSAWILRSGLPSLIAWIRTKRKDRRLQPVLEHLRDQHPFGKRADEVATALKISFEEAKKRLFQLEEQKRAWRDQQLRWHPGQPTQQKPEVNGWA